MKKLLILISIVLSAATTGLFADDIAAAPAPATEAAPNVKTGKHAVHAKHAKHGRKAHKGHHGKARQAAPAAAPAAPAQ